MEALFSSYNMASPEVRKSQAMILRRLHEKTLTISMLEEYSNILDEDIKVVCCQHCTSDLNLEPLMRRYDYELGEEVSGVDVEDLCSWIQTGSCDCQDHVLLVDSQQVSSCRLVHLAAMEKDYLPFLVYLCRKGCDLNATTSFKPSTPLTVAIAFNQIETVQFLLDTDMDLTPSLGSPLLSPLTQAVYYEHEDIVALLLKTKKIDINKCTDNYRQPLLVSCVRLHPEFVEMLLEAGADPNIATENGTSALMYAVSTRDMDLVKVLLRYGADVNKKNRRGEMALTIVIYREDAQMIQMLLDAGADPNYVTPDGQTPFLLAAYGGSVEITQALIKHGARFGQANELGYMPLHIAAWNGHLECVKLLLDAGAPHDTRTNDGNTPLALAAHGNHLPVIETLLALGCNVNNSDKDRDTPLQYAAYNGMTRAVELLIEHGANPNMVNSVNATALWNAVYMKKKEIVKLLLTLNVEMELDSIGINQHANTDQVVHVYDTPRSPLWVATAQNTPDIALLLITAGYNIQREKWIFNGQIPHATNARLVNFLLQYAHSPQRLVAICRNYFRRLFMLEVKSKVNNLPIPETLKSYLTLANMKYTVEQENEDSD